MSSYTAIILHPYQLPSLHVWIKGSKENLKVFIGGLQNVEICYVDRCMQLYLTVVHALVQY